MNVNLADLDQILTERGITRDSDTYDRASDLAIGLLVDAGLTSHDTDDLGAEIGDQVQTLLMAAILRSDQLADHLEGATVRWRPRDDDGAPCCPDPECGGNPKIPGSCTFPGYAANH